MISTFVVNLAQTVTLLVLISFLLKCETLESLSADEECVHHLEQQSPFVIARFSTGQLRTMCERKKMWIKLMLKPAEEADRVTLSPKQTDWLNQVHSCQDLLCTCEHDSTKADHKYQLEVRCANDSIERADHEMDRMNADKSAWRRRAKRHQREKTRSVVRKEYRMLTDEERRRFHSAMNNAKTDMIDDISKYDLLTVSHTPEQSPGAHFGPALLPFHRELLKQLEVILRAYDDTVAVPYWDTTLDEPLPNPADSVLWTEHFFGNGAGEVTSGPFKDWRSINDSQIEHLSPSHRILRSVGTHPNGGLFRRDDVERLTELEDFPALTYCVDPFFELLHGTVHMWVGGHMDEMRVSPNDPAFFLFHSHVDYLWEQWRRLKQTAKQREQHYPTDEQSCDSHHFKESLMKPFAIKNGEGLSNRYTDVFYSYEAAPTCSKEKAACGSEWLFCDTKARNPRCVSKIVIGGNCTGFESQDACYQSRCVNGHCRALLDDQQITSNLAAEEFSNDTDAVVIFTSNDMTIAMELNETEVEWNETEINATARDAEEGRSTTLFAFKITSATNTETTTPITATHTKASTNLASDVTATTTTVFESAQTASTSTATTKAETVPSRATSVKASAEIALSDEEVPSTTTMWNSERKLATRRPWPFFAVDIRTHKDSMGSVWLPITVFGMGNATHANQLSVTIRSKDRATNQTFDGVFGSPNNAPFYDGSAFVQVMSPFYSPTGHSVSDIIVADEEAQPCVSMCLVSRRVQPWKYVKCKAVLTLDVNPHNSDNVAFTPFKDQARLLNWRGSTKLPDQFMFICNTSVDTTGNSSTHSTESVEFEEALDENATVVQKDQTVDLPVKQKPRIENVKENHCINQHKCCSLWALVGECKQSPWMQFACQKSCFGCDDAQLLQRNDSAECIDYFHKCAKWTRNGKCATRADWMEENCRKSCGKCNRSIDALVSECGARRNLECRNYDKRCSHWAKRGDCKTNSWWMGQNCAQACGVCSATIHSSIA